MFYNIIYFNLSWDGLVSHLSFVSVIANLIWTLRFNNGWGFTLKIKTVIYHQIPISKVTTIHKYAVEVIWFNYRND